MQKTAAQLPPGSDELTLKIIDLLEQEYPHHFRVSMAITLEDGSKRGFVSVNKHKKIRAQDHSIEDANEYGRGVL